MKRRTHDAGRLASELASLTNLDRHMLIQRWQELYDTEPPLKIGSDFLRHAIAYRLQERMGEGLKPATLRFLAKVAEDASAGWQVSAPATVIKSGTRLLREWQGVTHEVLVEDGGVLWRGQRYRSLSEVARAITGTRWSGPRFFGLKEAA